MAYDWEEIYNQALRVIEEKGIRKITYLLPELPCGITQFYEFLDREPEKAKGIREKIDSIKILKKAKMLDKWETSGNPVLEIAAFKLLADQEEADILNTSKVKNENTHKFEDIPKITIIEAGSTSTGNDGIQAE